MGVFAGGGRKNGGWDNRQGGGGTFVGLGEGERAGPQGRPPQAAVGGRPQAAPLARAKPGLPCGPCAAACRGQQKAAPEGGPCFGIWFS